MKETKSFFRQKTPDLPLSVHYFSASCVDEKPRPLYRAGVLTILLMHAGNLHFHTASGMEDLTAGDMLAVPPMMLRSYHTVSLQTRYTILHISPDLFPFPETHFFGREFVLPLFRGDLWLRPLLRPGDPGYREICGAMKRLDLQKEGTKGYSMELFSVAMEICCALYPLCSRAQDAEDREWSVSEQCMNYIGKNYEQRLTLEELAAYVHLHPNYLCHLFREQTGTTVFEHINWVRVHAAAKLLRSTRLPVGQIATRSGYQNTNYFSRIFKQFIGRTPTAYRKFNQTK